MAPVRELGPASPIPLVGRDDELGRLQSWWTAVRGLTTPSLGVVSGESGVGKTRLVAELATDARDAGCTVLVGAAAEHGLLPYGPWVSALRDHLASMPAAERRHRLAGLGDDLAGVPWLADLAEGARGLRGPDERAVALAVTRVLAHLSRNGPVLVVVDDVHWCDQASIDLLGRVLAAPLPGIGVLVTERRPVADPGPWHEVEADRLAGPAWHLRLGRLDRAGCDRLARAVVGDAASDAVLEAVYLATDGNPFVARSVAELLRRSHRTPDAEIPHLPATAASIWAERFRPHARSQRVLAVAAVAGPSIELGWLRDAVGDAELVDAALGEAHDDGLVDVGDDGVVRFAHALLREHLFAQLTSTRRRRIHRSLARSRSASAGTAPSEQSSTIAHHWRESGRAGTAEAARHTVAAARWSLRQGGREQARALSDQARGLLAAAAEAGTEERLLAEVRADLGDLGLRLGHPEATSLLCSAAAHYEAAGDVDGLARLADALLRMNPSPGTTGPGVDLAERLVDRLDRVDASLHSRILSRLARALDGHVGSERWIEQLSSRALELARRSGDEDALAVALFCHASSRPWTDERLVQIRELVELGRRRDNLDYLLHGLGYLHTLLLDRGDLGEARAVLGELLEVQRRIPEGVVGTIRNGDLSREARVIVGKRRAHTAQLEGRFDDQEAAIGELAALLDQPDLELDRLIVTVAVQSGLLAWDRGRLTEFVPFTLDFAAADPDDATRSVCAAFVLAETDQATAARTYLDPLLASELAVLPLNLSTSFLLLLLADTVYLLGDAPGARLVERRLAAFSGRASCFIGGSGGPIDLGLARCAAIQGQPDRALPLLDRALAWCDRWGVLTFAARIHLARSEVLAAVGAPSAEIASHARRSLVLADELGMAAVARRARSLATTA